MDRHLRGCRDGGTNHGDGGGAPPPPLVGGSGSDGNGFSNRGGGGGGSLPLNNPHPAAGVVLPTAGGVPPRISSSTTTSSTGVAVSGGGAGAGGTTGTTAAASTTSSNNIVGGNIRAYGSTTSVPNCDYSKLSYYLKCCIIGCGIDFVFDISLLDYVNSHNFDDDCKTRIFQLAYEVFRSEVLLNRVIFLDDDNILMPEGISNVFYEVEAVSEFIQASPVTNVNICSPIIGTQIHVHKVMVCSSQWLDVFYVQPMTRLIRQHLPPSVAVALPMPVPDAAQSNGGSGGAGPDTVLSNPNHTRLPARESPYKHCDHCDGYHAQCTCNHGCPSSTTSQCIKLPPSPTSSKRKKKTHSKLQTFPCNQCGKRKILGRRYRCTTCCNPDYNLCNQCYTKTQQQQTQTHHTSESNNSNFHRRHDSTHSFERIDKIGSEPRPIHTASSNDIGNVVNAGAGRREVAASDVVLEEESPRPDTISSSVRMQDHNEGEEFSRPQVVSTTSNGNNDVLPTRSARSGGSGDAAAVAAAATTATTTTNRILQPGQVIRLRDMSSLPHVNGQQAIVFELLDEGSRYLVHVPILNMMLCVQTGNMEPILQVG